MMDANKSTNVRRRWLTAAFVSSPLVVTVLWCRFVDQEDFGAFVVGVFLSLLLGGVVLVRFLLKKSEQKHPVAHALLIFGSTIAGILVVFVAGSFAALLADGPQEAAWGFTLIFMLFAPIALLTGLTVAIRKYVRMRRAREAPGTPLSEA